MGIDSVSPITLFASGFTVNNYGHLAEANKVRLRDESRDVTEIGRCPTWRWGHILG